MAKGSKKTVKNNVNLTLNTSFSLEPEEDDGGLRPMDISPDFKGDYVWIENNKPRMKQIKLNRIARVLKF